MKVPITWLKDYVEFTSEDELMDKLTSVGHMQDGPPKKVGDTNVYDLEVRQNRPDCLSLLGIAREVAAVLGKKVVDPSNSLKDIPSVDGQTTIKVQDSDLCYRFNTVTIDSLKIAPSPDWLKNKLNAYGIKSVNNVVDVTNFVMVELGQPLHAFDTDKIKDATLIIRPAKKGESVKLLGEKKVALSSSDLVIADSTRVLALAGVMGGEDSSVTDKTTSIILEAATYNQASIRQSSLRHQTRTEASTRLEKFLHPTLTEAALKRAVGLILELCGGKIVDTTDEYGKKFSPITITLPIKRLNQLGGTTLKSAEVEKIAKNLELTVEKVNADSITVGIPYFRTDLQLPEDLVEEILRIHGYDQIPAHLPSAPPPQNIDSKRYLLEEQLRDLFTEAGLDEQITEPLTKESSPEHTPVVLENSLNSDKTMLRTTLRESLLRSVENHAKYRKDVIKLFEIGKIYYKKDSEFKEDPVLGIMTQGSDYFKTKGLIDLLCARFETTVDSATVEIEIVDEKKKLYFFEISLSEIKSQKTVRPYTEVPRILLEDLSLFVPENVKVGELLATAQTSSEMLSTVRLGEAPKVLKGKKTVFLHLEFVAQKGNITKEEISKEKSKIVKKLQETYKAELR